MKKIILFAIVSLLSVAEAAEISHVVLRQRWPWSQKVDIDYTLAGGKAPRVSIALTSEGETLIVPAGALSGDLLNVPPGQRTITFDPLLTAYTNRVLTNVSATLSVAEAPLYLIVDLTKDVTDVRQTTYLTAYDITNKETYGTYQVKTLSLADGTAEESVVWTGVTNNADYATTKLVLRYIPGGTFIMGSSGEAGRSTFETQHPVTISNAFFAGVFHVTCAQYELAMTGAVSSSGDAAKFPQRNNVTYDFIRGSTNAEEGINWPSTGDRVASASFLGKIRARTGIAFDLPTEAQWEYACRACTTNGCWNDGSVYLSDGSTTNSDSNLEKLGWYTKNSGYTIKCVGRKAANGWGLYDMHGNAWEYCLDWWNGKITGRPAALANAVTMVRRYLANVCAAAAVSSIILPICVPQSVLTRIRPLPMRTQDSGCL